MKTFMITVLSIILLLGVSLTTLHAVNDDSLSQYDMVTTGLDSAITSGSFRNTKISYN